MTKLEKGILVKIDSENFSILRDLYEGKGFLSFSAYPESYREISYPDEVGRLQMFRFVLEKDSKTS